MNSVKKIGKRLTCAILEHQVKQLRRKQRFTIVAVAGSVGKTSTKLAIASVLSATKKVRWQDGNYNDRLTVPLVLFGHSSPGLFNIFAWLKIIISNQLQVSRPFGYDIVVLELGTDGPGQIKEFAYLKPEYSVVSAVTPEHMEFFDSLDAVAEEELSVMDFSHKTFINSDDVPIKYLKQSKNHVTYGIREQADYRAVPQVSQGKAVQCLKVHTPRGATFDMCTSLLGAQGVKVALAACVIAHELGLSVKEIEQGVLKLKAPAGRMNFLGGVNRSAIIDDTYNSSPASVIAALDVLYTMVATQRIAILGTMNELGPHSKTMHEEVGAYCDPQKLDLLITIGDEAEKYIAAMARANGCAVKSFDSPYDAGEYAKNIVAKSGAVVLAKGSQNRVFAEESLKVLLADKNDESKLVRQSRYWMTIKKQQFGEKV